MPMKHFQALVDMNLNPINPNGCDGDLRYLGETYKYDVYWKIYRCEKCDKVVFTVEGSPHWWNFEVSEVIYE